MQGPVRYGPPRPPVLITVQEARQFRIWVACSLCRRGATLPPEALPVCRSGTSVGELWLRGRFRCAACGRPADAVILDCDHEVTRRERWALDEPFVAERLRRHWRARG